MSCFALVHHPAAHAVRTRNNRPAYLLDQDGNVLDILSVEDVDTILTQEDEYE